MQSNVLQYITKSCVQKDGTETLYRLYGNSGELVVLIPGFSCGMDMWNDIIENIGNDQKFSFLVIENRGFGSGRCLPYRWFSHGNSYSTTTMANDLWNVVSELRNWRRVHLIGFSMGGMIASKAASMYPEKVLSLTLLSTPQCGIHIMLPSWRTLKVIARVIPRCLLFRWCPLCQQKHCKEVTRHMRTFMELYLKYSEYYLLELMMKDTEDNKASVVPRWCCMEQQQGDDGQTHSLPTSISTAGQLRAIVCHRLTSEETKKIRRASWPVLCISGKYDQLVSARCCRSLARQLSADYITLPGAHFITEECSKQLHQLIRLFLEKKLVLLDEKTPWYFV